MNTTKIARQVCILTSNLYSHYNNAVKFINLFFTNLTCWAWFKNFFPLWIIKRYGLLCVHICVFNSFGFYFFEVWGKVDF